MRDYLTVTKQYFSEWLDINLSLFDRTGVFCVCSEKRDHILKGYGKKFPLYCLIKSNLAIISHSLSIQKQIPALTKALQSDFSITNLIRAIESAFERRPGHSRKYFFTQLPEGIDTSFVRQLTASDYSDFFRFYKAQYPKDEQDDWLEEYYMKITDKGYAFAAYQGVGIVSVADAPDVPYMADIIADPGIATLEPFRRRGYARAVLVATLKYYISLGMVPIWSCSASNAASSNLAESVGYAQFANAITLSSE